MSAAPKPDSSDTGEILKRSLAKWRIGGTAASRRARIRMGFRWDSSKPVSAFSPRARWSSTRNVQMSEGASESKPPCFQPCLRRMRFANGDRRTTCSHLAIHSNVKGSGVVNAQSSSSTHARCRTSSERINSDTAKKAHTTAEIEVTHQNTVKSPQTCATNCLPTEKPGWQKRACSDNPPPANMSAAQSGLQNAEATTPMKPQAACTATASTGSSRRRAWMIELHRG
mmetsp:Transcript_27064/g.76826  ORF Transcript_27064/g.76826 Transcript_27064/m.76826 type:complete len:227 (-) Transcript_27064:285-965(-)